ncbi:MAG: hypothetical protein JWP97_5280 [Labilithrix sp.]|nr:hypothetical protein [Labilithrix sp.]
MATMTRHSLVPALLLSTLASAVVACGSPPEPAPSAGGTPATTAPVAPLPTIAPPPPAPTASAAPPKPAATAQPDLALLDHTGDLCQGARPPAPPSSATASKVTVKQGTVQVTGSVNQDVTTALLASGKDQFAACYGASIDAKTPGAKTGGKVGGVFVFGTDGKVALSRLDQGATTADKESATCIARAICSMTFQPPSSGVVTVAHSMSLSTP